MFDQPLSSAASADTPHWYACYTQARHEKKVDHLLQERGIESFLPLVSRVRQWKDRKKVVPFVIFPSYVFARFPLSETSRVLSIPGVVNLVRNNGQPVAVREDELENVRRFTVALAAMDIEPELAPFPEVGDPVRIVSGPFRGIEGVMIERRGQSRVLVGLRAIGHGLEIDVQIGALEGFADGRSLSAPAGWPGMYSPER